MGWFTRRKEAEQATLIAAMSKAFAEALGGVLTAQSEQIKQSSQFLGTLQDLSARKAATIMGSRGGRKTQERKRKAREAQDLPACRLCRNPMARGVTLQEIDAHRLHAPLEPSQEPEHVAQEPERGN